jgi:hypothetical protein
MRESVALVGGGRACKFRAGRSLKLPMGFQFSVLRFQPEIERCGCINQAVRATEKEASVEDCDFSRVRTIFHVISPIFHPLFQLEIVGSKILIRNARV